jgi:hypothetical protein
VRRRIWRLRRAAQVWRTRPGRCAVAVASNGEADSEEPEPQARALRRELFSRPGGELPQRGHCQEGGRRVGDLEIEVSQAPTERVPTRCRLGPAPPPGSAGAADVKASGRPRPFVPGSTAY